MSRTQAMNKLLIVVGLLFILLISLQSHAGPTHQHKMDVELLPGLKMIKAEDQIQFPAGTPRRLSFLLHKDLQVQVIGSSDQIQLLNAGTTQEPYSEYGLTLGLDDNKVTLNFFGVIHDAIVNDSSRGLISPEGTALFASTYWYPVFLDSFSRFEISVKTPDDWRALVQGQEVSTRLQKGSRISQFTEIYPQEGLFLVAGPFHVSEKTLPSGRKVQVLLRQKDPNLANSLLSVMPEYLDHFSRQIAPYPYSTFTLVENFWETGYGMPSFTLLGPKVLRLPFILNSSVPHEILHSWWGHSVYVDYDRGNWSEGLTTYMADHWQAEVAGEDRKYREQSLMNFTDFVLKNPGADFPLRGFKGRHNSSSQAVGYHKSLMLFHMLEYRFGKDVFRKAMQDFYRKNVFTRVGFEEIQESFERVTNQKLSGFFSQWLDRTGAPTLELGEVKAVSARENSYVTTYELKQKGADLYDLMIPVTWTLENGEEVRQMARLTSASQTYSLSSKLRPVKIAVDRDYHVFRTLDQTERPVTLSMILGSPKVHFYFDFQSPEQSLFAAKWIGKLSGQKEVHHSQGLFEFPSDGALVLIGDGFADFMRAELAGQEFRLEQGQLALQGQEFRFDEVSTVIVARLTSRPQQVVVWVRASRDNEPGEWAERLTHYGNFGLLVFKGRPAVLKSAWPVTSSPLQRQW